MRIFRSRYMRPILVLLTGLTFLNVSFLQVEVKFLREIVGDNISLTLISQALEGEGEIGETEDDQNEKEPDLIFHLSHVHRWADASLSQKIKCLTIEASLHQGYLKKFSPPPEA